MPTIKKVSSTEDPKTKVKQEILRFLDRKTDKAFNPKQITRALKYPPETFERLVGELLNEMVQAGELERHKGKKYTIRRVQDVLEGTLLMTKSRVGYVRINEELEVFISDRNLHTAFHEDRVKVALFAKKHNDKVEGEITRIISRTKTQFVGTVEKGRNFYFVIPDDKRIHRDFFVPERWIGKAKHGDKVVFEMKEWENPKINPEAKIIEVLGKAKDLKVQVVAVAKGMNLPYEFPKSVEKEAEIIPVEFTEKDFKGREDLRSWDIFTIDPDDAKDFDDAISFRPLENGHIELGVHIADVSHYLVPDTELDAEAVKRGTSIYMVDRVIPMLPEKLSNHVCSLVPNQDRLTYSCMMEITPKGDVISWRFAKTIIHSKRRFSYEEVEKVIQTGKGDFVQLIQKMNKLAKTITAKRMKNGSIDFDSPEAKFKFNAKGEPIEISVKERLDSHRLIEEFMLLANQCAATTFSEIYGKLKIPFVYRVHDLPDTGKLINLAKFVEPLGYKLVVGNDEPARKSLQQLMTSVAGKEIEHVVHTAALRSMAKAVYQVKNIGHYGLSFEHYTHFTSPIRRYPDVLVHRLLTHAVLEKNKTPLYPAETLQTMLDHCNLTERKAVEAERESIKLMQVEFMRQHVGESFEGVISGVTQYGVYVEVKDILIEGMVSVRDLTDDYYVYDEKQYSLIGERKKKVFRLGDHVKVVCMGANPTKRVIDFVFE